jgi:integrase
MKALARQPSSQAPSDGWCWPIDLTHYDRSPCLSDAERQALDELVDRFAHGRRPWPGRLAQALQHLLCPLYDAVDAVQISANLRGRVIARLCREMQQHGTPFWAWTEQEWIALLSAPSASTPNQSDGPGYRQYLIAVAYLLCGFTNFRALRRFYESIFAVKIFGQPCVERAQQQVCDELRRWGYRGRLLDDDLPKALAIILLVNHSPRLEDLSLETLRAIRRDNLPAHLAYVVDRLARVLGQLGLLPAVLNPEPDTPLRRMQAATLVDVPASWVQWCQRWYLTSTVAAHTRETSLNLLLKVGRWLQHEHPEVVTPEQWTRELVATFIAAVDRWTVGTFVVGRLPHDRIGQPLSARTKYSHLQVLRKFFTDLQEWGWIPRSFDPARAFRTPATIKACLTTNPRVIADDVWAKLLWAGLNLTCDDLPGSGLATVRERDVAAYPLAMVRAMAMVWLLAGLRSDEIGRLRVGCVRWQPSDITIPGTDQVLAKESVCWLDVPVNKTGSAFTKPVDVAVGQAIAAWEQVRPAQPLACDPKTGEAVAFLFSYRGRRVGGNFLNGSIIPILCRKAGVPQHDARGPITSHRARSTIASQLYNAKEPMSLFELQEWLGHRTPASTQYYAKITPTHLAKSFEQAGYFERNVRTIEVLIDQEAIRNGDAAGGLPWKYYDLGHGYCTYDFFERCEHRMACAHCAFYRPKNAFLELLQEKQAHLLHMKQDIPLTDLELATVEGDLTATELLIAQLSTVPTPAGSTPRQLQEMRQTEAGCALQAAGLAERGREERRGEGGDGGTGAGVGT